MLLGVIIKIMASEYAYSHPLPQGPLLSDVTHFSFSRRSTAAAFRLHRREAKVMQGAIQGFRINVDIVEAG